MNQAIILDTKVLVSAWHKPQSDLSTILEAAMLCKMPVHICPAIVDEYKDVLSRPKFEKLGPWQPWLDRLLLVAFNNPDPDPWPNPGADMNEGDRPVASRPLRPPRAPHVVTGPSPVTTSGPDDLIFLALAKATGAVLVTGNLADFPETIRAGVTVLSPSEYLHRR